MVDVIVVAIIILAVGAAIWYIHKSSKKGIKCVGCPYAASCSSQKSCDSLKKKED